VSSAYAIVLAHGVAAPLGAWWYFRRFAVTRPPVGVFNERDVVFMSVAIVVVPFVYLALPIAVVATLLCLVALNLVYVLVRPIAGSAQLTLGLALAAVAADALAAIAYGSAGNSFLAVNNVALVLLAVAVANLLAQAGMRASSLALLAGFLALYDGVATAALPVMRDLFERLGGAPFAPFVAWRTESGGLGLGLGDLLVLALAPLVFRKAFGVPAGAAAAAVSVATAAIVLAVLELRLLETAFPVLVALGPAVVAQYAFWIHRRGCERTTREYLLAEPNVSSPNDAAASRKPAFLREHALERR